MTNQERLKEYLAGKQGYLKNDISNGKVIMLSGKWGSGKTHFWQNKISEDLKVNLKKEEKVYSYISLYGKSSIDEIENDIFGQVYYDAIGGENLVTKTASTFTKLTKRYGGFSSLLDFSKLAEAGEEEQKNNIERTALSRLNNGGIVCFDDFERKSKDIDLNDLFGFITQLTLNFKCKVVIILNDDVFEGEEKDVFSRVKEKSVSKFLKYEPSIRELFKSIFYERKKDNKNKFKYLKLRKYKKIILRTIEETEELNARIYIQVLDNLLEWLEKNQEMNDDIVRCLILVNINFVLNHKIVLFKIKNSNTHFDVRRYCIKGLEKEDKYVKLFNKVSCKRYSDKSILDHLINDALNPQNHTDSKKENGVRFINDNKSNIYAINFLKTLDFDKNISEVQLNKINNFIETGILINE